MRNTKLLQFLIVIIFFTSCETNKKDDFSFIGISYNKVIKNPDSGIKIVDAPPIFCEIYKTHLITKDTVYYYVYDLSTNEASYRYSINDKRQNWLDNGLLNSIDTLIEMEDSTYEHSPITLFDQKNDSLQIRNYQLYRFDKKSRNLIDSLTRYLDIVNTKELKDTARIYNLNKKIEKFNIIDRRPDIRVTIH